MTAVVDFLILGHPRSGTGYMAQLFTALGYEVGHERVAEHGISSWMFAVYAEEVPYTFDGKTRGDIHPRHVLQVVRNPIDVISSMAHTVHEEPAWEFIERYALVHREAPFEIRAVQSVIAWNRLIQGHFPRPTLVNLENAAVTVHDFLTRAGYKPPALRDVTLPPANYNTRPHPRLGRGELIEKLPCELLCELQIHACQYGYQI